MIVPSWVVAERGRSRIRVAPPIFTGFFPCGLYIESGRLMGLDARGRRLWSRSKGVGGTEAPMEVAREGR